MKIKTACVSFVAAFWTELLKKEYQLIYCSLLNSTSWYFARTEHCLIPKREFWLCVYCANVVSKKCFSILLKLIQQQDALRWRAYLNSNFFISLIRRRYKEYYQNSLSDMQKMLKLYHIAEKINSFMAAQEMIMPCVCLL